MPSLVEIRDGLEQGEFFLEYLPTVSLADGRCLGGEALIRWRRPSGVVPPMEFIPVAENTPLSGRITYFVVDTLAAELGAWLRAHPQAHISFNVPPEILGRGGLEYAARAAGLLELAPQLVVEITERGVPDPLGLQSIDGNWSLGARLALDDLTLLGGANLAVLARCNFQMIKLDTSLVAQITAESPSPVWLDGIAAFVRASDLQVVAEGVETEGQLHRLREARVQAAQGFYFSRPLSASDFIAFHQSRNGG
jgi:sensor c-di-GMP phosphodiesterase-like protein